VLGCLKAACAPAVIVTPSSGLFLVVWSTTRGAFVMTPLRQRMLEDLQIRNYSPNTVAAYIRRVAEFAKHYSNTLHRSVSIDRIPLPRYEKKLPVILSPAEVQRLLETPKNLSHRTILTTM